METELERMQRRADQRRHDSNNPTTGWALLTALTGLVYAVLEAATLENLVGTGIAPDIFFSGLSGLLVVFSWRALRGMNLLVLVMLLWLFLDLYFLLTLILLPNAESYPLDAFLNSWIYPPDFPWLHALLVLGSALLVIPAARKA